MGRGQKSPVAQVTEGKNPAMSPDRENLVSVPRAVEALLPYFSSISRRRRHGMTVVALRGHTALSGGGGQGKDQQQNEAQAQERVHDADQISHKPPKSQISHICPSAGFKDLKTAGAWPLRVSS